MGDPHKWAVFVCPCGYGHDVALNLLSVRGTHWRVFKETPGVSITPSVDATYQSRRCHYWILRGRVHWC